MDGQERDCEISRTLSHLSSKGAGDVIAGDTTARGSRCALLERSNTTTLGQRPWTTPSRKRADVLCVSPPCRSGSSAGRESKVAVAGMEGERSASASNQCTVGYSSSLSNACKHHDVTLKRDHTFDDKRSTREEGFPPNAPSCIACSHHMSDGRGSASDAVSRRPTIELHASLTRSRLLPQATSQSTRCHTSEGNSIAVSNASGSCATCGQGYKHGSREQASRRGESVGHSITRGDRPFRKRGRRATPATDRPQPKTRGEHNQGPFLSAKRKAERVRGAGVLFPEGRETATAWAEWRRPGDLGELDANNDREYWRRDDEIGASNGSAAGAKWGGDDQVKLDRGREELRANVERRLPVRRTININNSDRER